MLSKQENTGCGCGNVPILLIVLLLGTGYWGFKQLDRLEIGQFLSKYQSPTVPQQTSSQQTVPQQTSPQLAPSPSQPVPVANTPLQPIIPIRPSPTPPLPTSSKPRSSPTPNLPLPTVAQSSASLQPLWQQKEIRGIYLSRYQATNNASEQTIRERVRYYRSQGFNTIIHGVWGNGCTMYNSEVMQQVFQHKSCPNQFQDQWLNWLIDEAHQQGMEVHAYFEKGIKIDQNSLIFHEAVAKKWIVPGVDKTYASVDHYVLDVELPEVYNLFRQISVEFVKKYPTIDAVQWDDYLGYHADLPGKVDRTARLTRFVRQMKADIKRANPAVSFDLCHHNPYWGKRYFAADWEKWGVDRVFIQIYNDANFAEELAYAEKYAGVAIADTQLHRLKELVHNSKVKSILVFPFDGKPESSAASVAQKLTSTRP